MEITREQQLYDKLKFARERNDALHLQLQQSQDRERVLQEKLDKIQETHTDNEGYVWDAPTSYAYYTACKALYKHKNNERVLREALEEIKSMYEGTDNGVDGYGFMVVEIFREGVIKIASKALEASK